MDPISIGISAVGFGLSLFGAKKQKEASEAQAAAARQVAAYSGDIATQEQGINDLKQKQMEMEGRRTQLQNVRNMQRSRAMAVNAAVSQGAQGGSGIQGGLAQVENQGLFNMQGVQNALEVGRGINSYNKLISQDKIGIAQQQGISASAQGDAAEGQGLMSLGGTLLKSGGTIGSMFSNVSKGNPFGSLFGGGSPSGY